MLKNKYLKKHLLKFLTILIFLINSGSLFAKSNKWEFIGKLNSGHDLYFDKTSLEINEDKRKFFYLMDYPKKDQFGDLSYVIQSEVNCKLFYKRDLKDFYFSQHMGRGKPFIFSKMSQWRLTPKGSSLRSLLNYICMK